MKKLYLQLDKCAGEKNRIVLAYLGPLVARKTIDHVETDFVTVGYTCT